MITIQTRTFNGTFVVRLGITAVNFRVQRGRIHDVRHMIIVDTHDPEPIAGSECLLRKLAQRVASGEMDPNGNYELLGMGVLEKLPG